MDNINLDTLDTEFEKAVNSSKVHDSLSFHSVKFMEDIYVKYRIFFFFFLLAWVCIYSMHMSL